VFLVFSSRWVIHASLEGLSFLSAGFATSGEDEVLEFEE
jgi:hypothetical protein